MWSWLHAAGLSYYHGFGWFLLHHVVPLIAGAAAGAALGSIRRWYAARWQFGFCFGLGISGQYAILGCLWGTPSPFENWRQVVLGASALAFVVAAISSAAAEWWFSETAWSGVLSFRDHPWQWLRWRMVRLGGAVCVVILIAAWVVVEQEHIARFHQLLPYWADYQAAERKWKPHGAFLTGDLGHSLHLIVRSKRALSPEALCLIDESPWPMVGVYIFGANDVRDDDLINACDKFTGIHTINLLNSPLTDQCLPALAACVELKSLEINNCSLITAAGIAKFRELRPDVQVRLESHGVLVTTSTTSP